MIGGSDIAAPVQVTAPGLAVRVAGLEWSDIARRLDEDGYALINSVLTASESQSIATLYAAEDRFRSRIVMARHGFGRGEYKYFAYPLPAPVAELRASLYPPLSRVANIWFETLGRDARFPEEPVEFLERCHRAGQTRPTPLLLAYQEGDYNCLHQDLYGEHVFPLQAAFLLSQPGHDFTGGELVLCEQRPRRQSRVEVVPLRQGDGVIFPVHHRPVQGVRGSYRAVMRHGVSRVRSGHRMTLGIIFHDAE